MLPSEKSNHQSVKLYDLQLIQKMCRGDEERIAKMVDVFIDQTAKAIEEIASAYSEKDFIRIARLVHKIKPTLTYFGVETLEKEAHNLENLLENTSESSEIEFKILSFTTQTKEVVISMKNDFNVN